MLGGKGADDMQRSLLGTFVKRAAHGFAIDRDDFPIQSLRIAGDPSVKTLFEVVGVNEGEHPAKGVMRWHTIPQIQECREPSLLHDTVIGHIGPGFCTGNDGADCNDQDIK